MNPHKQLNFVCWRVPGQIDFMGSSVVLLSSRYYTTWFPGYPTPSHFSSVPCRLVNKLEYLPESFIYSLHVYMYIDLDAYTSIHIDIHHKIHPQALF